MRSVLRKNLRNLRKLCFFKKRLCLVIKNTILYLAVKIMTKIYYRCYGVQSGGLVRAILSDPNKEFIARVLTRNIDSDKVKELADTGLKLYIVDR